MHIILMALEADSGGCCASQRREGLWEAVKSAPWELGKVSLVLPPAATMAPKPTFGDASRRDSLSKVIRWRV